MLAAVGVLAAGLCAPANAQGCAGTMRRVNVGVSVSPPNVIHAAAYVAKDLGIFAKHCIDANIVQFDGGSSPAATAALAQGNTFGSVGDVLVGRGLKVKQVWGFSPRAVQSYMVSEPVKTAADLKGRRLSAAGGGVGSFNWRIGREALRKANLTVDDAQFISQGTAGRMAGLVAGQIDAVALHPEDAYLAMKQKPGVHALYQVADLLPLLMFNAYGVHTDMIANNRALVVDFVAAMIETNRLIYRERDKVVPLLAKATTKPEDAVAYAWEQLTKNCYWSINEGFERERTQWSIDNSVEHGDIDAAKKPTVEQVADEAVAREGVEKAGGRTTIGACTL